MIGKRTVPVLMRCLLIALMMAVLAGSFASAESLFPSPDQALWRDDAGHPQRVEAGG